jgi:hypothetical protein
LKPAEVIKRGEIGFFEVGSGNGKQGKEKGNKTPHTEIKVPGKNTNVTSVTILIDTVSFSVFLAIFRI